MSSMPCYYVVIDGVPVRICEPILYTPIDPFHWHSPIHELIFERIYDKQIPAEIQVSRQVETLSAIGLLAKKLSPELRKVFHDEINNSLSTMFRGHDVKMDFSSSNDQEDQVNQDCSDCS